jgi:hypothetical protein
VSPAGSGSGTVTVGGGASSGGGQGKGLGHVDIAGHNAGRIGKDKGGKGATAEKKAPKKTRGEKLEEMGKSKRFQCLLYALFVCAFTTNLYFRQDVWQTAFVTNGAFESLIGDQFVSRPGQGGVPGAAYHHTDWMGMLSPDQFYDWADQILQGVLFRDSYDQEGGKAGLDGQRYTVAEQNRFVGGVRVTQWRVASDVGCFVPSELDVFGTCTCTEDTGISASGCLYFRLSFRLMLTRLRPQLPPRLHANVQPATATSSPSKAGPRRTGP